MAKQDVSPPKVFTSTILPAGLDTTLDKDFVVGSGEKIPSKFLKGVSFWIFGRLFHELSFY